MWGLRRYPPGAPTEMRVSPRLPRPVDQVDAQLDAEPPALIRRYLRLGAKVLGPPAWDPDFNTADLPLLMRLDELAPRFRRDFLRSA